MTRVLTSAHVHAETKTPFSYVATWTIEGSLLTWQATVSLPGRSWSLAGGAPGWHGGSDASAVEAVQEDVRRSIDGLEI
jgi:hypothetical protein